MWRCISKKVHCNTFIISNMTAVHFRYNKRLATDHQYSFIEKYFITWFRTSFSCTCYGGWWTTSCQYQTNIFRWICGKTEIFVIYIACNYEILAFHIFSARKKNELDERKFIYPGTVPFSHHLIPLPYFNCSMFRHINFFSFFLFFFLSIFFS